MEWAWFRRWGWAYRPVSAEGWAVTAVTAGTAAWWAVVIDRHSHSVSDTLLGLWPYLAPLAILWGWVASNTAVAAGRGR